MVNINVNNTTSISVEMSDKEKDCVKKAYWILKDIANELWRKDADETETYGNTMTACDCIYQFMRDDVDFNVDETRWM